MLIKLNGNKPVSYTPFASGWLQDNGKVLGRPVDIEIASDGALLVSDDKNGAIYRITYGK
jgi:glucose/arabinose dehydrogenase